VVQGRGVKASFTVIACRGPSSAVPEEYEKREKEKEKFYDVLNFSLDGSHSWGAEREPSKQGKENLRTMKKRSHDPRRLMRRRKKNKGRREKKGL